MGFDRDITNVTLQLNLEVSKLESELEDLLNGRYTFITHKEKNDKIIEILKEITIHEHMVNKWLNYINANQNNNND